MKVRMTGNCRNHFSQIVRRLFLLKYSHSQFISFLNYSIDIFSTLSTTTTKLSKNKTFKDIVKI